MHLSAREDDLEAASAEVLSKTPNSNRRSALDFLALREALEGPPCAGNGTPRSSPPCERHAGGWREAAARLRRSGAPRPLAAAAASTTAVASTAKQVRQDALDATRVSPYSTGRIEMVLGRAPGASREVAGSSPAPSTPRAV